MLDTLKQNLICSFLANAQIEAFVSWRVAFSKVWNWFAE